MSVFDLPPKPPRRDQQVRIMMGKDEKRRMEDAAKRLDITVSDLIRTAVNDFVARTSSKK